MRCKCVNPRNIEGLKDPELTLNKFYQIIDSNIQVSGADVHFVSFKGDSKTEVQRPSVNFKIFKK